MTRLLLALLFFGCSVSGVRAQNGFPKLLTRRFPADTALSAIDSVMSLLKEYHPGLYRYSTPAAFGQYVDSIRGTVRDSLTSLEIWRKLAPIIARVNCLHTEIAPAKGITKYLNNQPTLLPLQLYFKDGRAYIIHNYSGIAAIRPGDEVLAINGRPVRGILDVLLGAIGSDGHNTTLKYRELYYNFPVWYRNMIELTTDYMVQVRQNRGVTEYRLAGGRMNELAADWFLRPPVFARRLDFQIRDNIGYLTLHTFDEPELTNSGQLFKQFIDSVFQVLNQQGIPNLILDLRSNGGGEDTYAEYLTSHFFDRPFRYWDRIECTEGVARAITRDKEARRVLRPAVRKDSVWLWQKARTTTEFDFYELQQPSPDHYTGKVYALINGYCQSSCADIAAVLSYNKKVILIGEETGGGYIGNNSGILANSRIRPFGLVMTVPWQKYFNAVDPVRNPDRGVFPDYPVETTVEDLVSGRDREMEMALSLIRGVAVQVPGGRTVCGATGR